MQTSVRPSWMLPPIIDSGGMTEQDVSEDRKSLDICVSDFDVPRPIKMSLIKLSWFLGKSSCLIDNGDALVFASKKVTVDILESQLAERGLKVAALQGDKDQASHMETLQKFKFGTFHVLIATDVAAFFDIKSIKSLVNFDIARDRDMHVHCISRTGHVGDKDWTTHILITTKEARFTGELVNSLIVAGQNVPMEQMDLLTMKDGKFHNEIFAMNWCFPKSLQGAIYLAKFQEWWHTGKLFVKRSALIQVVRFSVLTNMYVQVQFIPKGKCNNWNLVDISFDEIIEDLVTGGKKSLFTVGIHLQNKLEYIVMNCSLEVLIWIIAVGTGARVLSKHFTNFGYHFVVGYKTNLGCLLVWKFFLNNVVNKLFVEVTQKAWKGLGSTHEAYCAKYLCVILQNQSHSLKAYIGVVKLLKEKRLIEDGLLDLICHGYIAENQQQNIQDANDLLPRLTTGIDVKIKFRRIDDSEFIRDCTIFDLLDITLYHYGIVDPEDNDIVNAIGSKSFNTLMEDLVEFETQNVLKLSEVVFPTSSEDIIAGSNDEQTMSNNANESAYLKESEPVVPMMTSKGNVVGEIQKSCQQEQSISDGSNGLANYNNDLITFGTISVKDVCSSSKIVQKILNGQSSCEESRECVVYRDVVVKNNIDALILHEAAVSGSSGTIPLSPSASNTQDSERAEQVKEQSMLKPDGKTQMTVTTVVLLSPIRVHLILAYNYGTDGVLYCSRTPYLRRHKLDLKYIFEIRK